MQEQLITFETAKLAKEKGFNLNSHGYYSCDDPASGAIPNQLFLRTWETWTKFGSEESQEGTLIYSAPTQALLQRWLREVHKINVIPYPIESFKNEIPIEELNPEYTYQLIVKGIKTFITNDKIFESYEEAFETGLQEAFKLI